MTDMETISENAIEIYDHAFDLFDRGIMDQAEILFQSLTFIEPDWRDAWVGFGICLRVGGKLEEAQFAFDVARKIAPDDSAVLFHRCELACAQKDWGQARAEAQEFLALGDAGRPVAGHAEMAQLVDFLHARSAGVTA